MWKESNLSIRNKEVKAMFENITFGTVLVASLVIVYAIFLSWVWRNTPARYSGRRRRSKEKQFSNSLGFTGYWDKIQSTKNHFGR